MASELSRQQAAQAWCTPTTEKKVMDPELAEAFADILDGAVGELELAWGIIANAGGGDWDRETPTWREAAEKWRDRYYSQFVSTKEDNGNE